MSTIGLVILTAGASTRMGTPKQLLLFQGQSLLRHIAEVAVASCCEPVVVVLGSQASRMKIEIDDLALYSVENQQWADGMGTSISAGVTALSEINSGLDAVVIMLCDQPFVSADLINHLAQSIDQLEV